mmetsp:Transcript_25764/g.41638  ORF Transcript_25764/g.41638 Transcript_25764/m.41638 type:complete len:216 (+) Transcript_25764:808-1455(+)
MAIAETIFGFNNPSGRLTQTFYPESFTKNVSMTDMNMHPNPKTGFPGRTYRFYKGPVLLPFGFGMSYTDFGYTVQDMGLGSNNSCQTFQVVVKNSGSYSGEHVMLAFLHPPESLVESGMHGDLIKKLHSYHRTSVLGPNESQRFNVTVSFDVDLGLFLNDSDTAPTVSSSNQFSNEKDAWRLELYGGQTELYLPIGRKVLSSPPSLADSLWSLFR